MRHLLRGFALLLLVLLTIPAHADELSQPLGPWYRPGKYVPVHVTADLSAPATVTVVGDGSPVRTRVRAAEGRLDVVVPWLAPGSPRPTRLNLALGSAAASAPGPELRPLGDGDRLVAWTVPDNAFARRLLGAAVRIVPVTLDSSQPLPGDPAAWEALDVLILDPASAARLSESQLAGFLACGTTVAVKTGKPPFGDWPWKRDGEYAVLAPAVAGPANAAYFDAAYLPVADWQPGQPWPVRRRALVIAALCCLPLLAVALWRPRFAPVWAVGVVALMGLGLVGWQRTHPPIRQAAGEIVTLFPDGVTQTDRWTYQTSPAAVTVRLSWESLTHPVTSGDFAVTLTCTPAGQPVELTAELPANRKLAYLSRVVTSRGPARPPVTPVTSPLAGLAGERYAGSNGKIAGQLPAAPGGWPSVVVDRRKESDGVP